jgi:hypothetical protein
MNWFLNFIIQNILWEAILGLLLYPFISIVRALFITKKILRQNRPSRGGGYGKHFADRFIDIWLYPSGLSFVRNQQYRFLNEIHSFIFQSVIDDELIKLKLVVLSSSISEAHKQLLKPVKNLRNKFVYIFTKLYLIYFMGDSKFEYKEREKRLKNLSN